MRNATASTGIDRLNKAGIIGVLGGGCRHGSACIFDDVTGPNPIAITRDPGHRSDTPDPRPLPTRDTRRALHRSRGPLGGLYTPVGPLERALHEVNPDASGRMRGGSYDAGRRRFAHVL